MAIPVATIASEGVALDPAVGIVSLEVRRELDRIPEARLVLQDGSLAKRRFDVSNAAWFEPGKHVTIHMRRGDEVDQQVFEGLVVRHAVEQRSSGVILRVELKDAAFTLTRQRKSAVFRDQPDDEVMRTLIEDGGLAVGTIDPIPGTHRELVQYQASDWDFLLTRADICGRVVHVEDGTVSVRAMSSEAEPQWRFEWGLDAIYEFELELDGAEAWAKAAGKAWDPSQDGEPLEADDVEPEAGELDPEQLALRLGGDNLLLVLPGALAPEELQSWANARLARSRLALLRGRMVIEGRVGVSPLDRVELGGVGRRFDGGVLVSGVTQRLDHEGWRTELRFGLSPRWFARTPEIADVPAGGLLPPVTGLQLGRIDAFEADPDGAHRVKVRLPAFDDLQGAVWARLARPDAGDGRGVEFWPELGDEVVVGFVADDPRQAIVLGSLHGPTHAPPDAIGGPSEANHRRGIVSKAGIVVGFDDERPALTIETPAKNSVVIDDDAGAIRIRDQHGNTITMDAKGIEIDSANDLSIRARGNVVIGGRTVDIL